MWNSHSTLARNGRSTSYIDRTPKSCPGSWDKPLLLGVEVNGDWQLMGYMCRSCARHVEVNSSGAVKRHRRAVA